MNHQVPVQSFDEPASDLVGSDINTLRTIHEILSSTTRREASVQRRPETMEKGTNTLLSSIVLGGGLDDGNAFLGQVCGILRETLETIARAPDPLGTMECVIAALNPEQDHTILGTHRTTVDSLLPRWSKAEADTFLARDYSTKLAHLEVQNAKSKRITMTIDDTHEGTRSRFLNGAYSYIQVGQKQTWERGFKYSCIYDATHQMFVGCLHHDYHLTVEEKRSLRPWIQELVSKVDIARQAGCEVAVIEGDRSYFAGEFFAAATLGHLNPGTPPREQPRVVVPRKFTREKEKFKWAYLISRDRPAVFLEHVGLDPYSHPALKTECQATFERADNYQYMIPYACVAVVDEYTRKHSRSLGKVRNRARATQSNLERLERDLTATLHSYKSHHATFSTRRPGNPLRGRSRETFHDAKDKYLYQRAQVLARRLNTWKEEKTSLLNTLMFFAVSLRPGEDPTRHPRMFQALARDYHERWGIENGFRDVKQVFVRSVRNRKPTRRQLNLVTGMVLYNHWHTRRLLEALESYRKTASNRVPWHPRRPWIRRKLEQEINGVVSARAFLVEIWGLGVRSCIKKRIEAQI